MFRGTRIKGVIRMNLKGVNNNTKDSTLCWGCERACGRCSWSKSFVPVEGWTATPTKVGAGNNLIDSFIVYKCPEFKPLKLTDERKLLNHIKRNIGRIRKVDQNE